MKVLVLGSGAREHAIAWKLSRSSRVQRVYSGPGNAGTEAVAVNVPSVDIARFDTVLSAVRAHGVDCVFVGPELPLAGGVVDFLAAHNVPAIGPAQGPARLETSKSFSKAFMTRNSIPTAQAMEFRDAESFEAYVRGRVGSRMVVKKSGLAAGKGVLESSDTGDIVRFGRSALSGDAVLVEEFLRGWEVSIFGLSDGKSFMVLPPCTDFKKAHDGDSGPNTGGMGSICPVPWVDAMLMDRIVLEVVAPTYAAMEKEGLSYAGVLYFGLMITEQGPKVLEFNARLGDPEAQVLLPMVDLDFGDLTEALASGTLSKGFARASAAIGASGEKARAALAHAHAREKAALGVVIAGKGYPESTVKGISAEIREDSLDGALVFHASTSRDASGSVLTGGGRSFTVVGMGGSLAEASRKAYRAVDSVRFDGGWHRNDIGAKFMEGKR